MQLLILSDQFIIKYSPAWMVILLLSGLLLFFASKKWRKHLRKSQQHSFIPGVLFTVSFIFLIGGINLYVYKIVLNKDGIILFNIKQFNEHINWLDMQRVEYQDRQQIIIVVTEKLSENRLQDKTVQIDLAKLDKDSMDKVKILIDLKIRQNKKQAFR